ncbi:MAG: hypothetical protein R6U01_00465 [Halorubrum sp.]
MSTDDIEDQHTQSSTVERYRATATVRSSCFGTGRTPPFETTLAPESASLADRAHYAD